VGGALEVVEPEVVVEEDENWGRERCVSWFGVFQAGLRGFLRWVGGGLHTA
jgi:hypothetical protein